MGEISPIAAKNVDPHRFEQFKSDLTLLLKLITQDELGRKMGINRSNVNKYVHGNLPVTKGFIGKFYAGWEDRIKLENDKIRQETSSGPALSLEEEPSLRAIMTILVRIEAKIDQSR